jgi:hypothetical protein
VTARVDTSPFGTRAPGVLDRAVLAATRAMPNGWRTSLFALREARGYTAFARSRHNVALRRG